MIRNNVCFSGRDFLIFPTLTFKFFLLLLPVSFRSAEGFYKGKNDQVTLFIAMIQGVI